MISQSVDSFSTSIASCLEMIKYPMAVWAFNELLQMQMKEKRDKGEAMILDYFC